MPEIALDNSIVAIRSYVYGTYLKACSDQKSLKLQKIVHPNKLPKNCLWTLQSKPILGYSIASLKFISCYGRYLAIKGFLWREVCQDNVLTSYARWGSTNWTYDQFGTTGGREGYRLMSSVSGVYMCAKKNGEVCVDFNPFYLSLDPEVYWTIHRVGNEDDLVVPRTPQENCLMEDEDEDEKERCVDYYGKSVTIINSIGVPVYNHSTVNNSGGNINLSGNQQNGGVIAGNTDVRNESGHSSETQK